MTHTPGHGSFCREFQWRERQNPHALAWEPTWFSDQYNMLIRPHFPVRKRGIHKYNYEIMKNSKIWKKWGIQECAKCLHLPVWADGILCKWKHYTRGTRNEMHAWLVTQFITRCRMVYWLMLYKLKDIPRHNFIVFDRYNNGALSQWANYFLTIYFFWKIYQIRASPTAGISCISAPCPCSGFDPQLHK